MSDPVAFLLTFRTHGTWLHGDERGSVDREHNVFGTPLLDPNLRRAACEARRMRGRPMQLDKAMRAIVEAAIRDQCQYRGWELMEVAVRTNHVHVLIGYAGASPEAMTRELKARATRWLHERRMVKPGVRIWAARAGSCRYLWRSEQIDAAASYVREGQDVPH